jgi:transketolase C-terminal domain/subunit
MTAPEGPLLMSNVTDAKLWQGISMSNAPSHVPTNQPQVILPNQDSTAREGGSHVDSSDPDLAGLSMILRHLGDGDTTRIHWGFSQAASQGIPLGDPFVRLDPQHEIDRPIPPRSPSEAALVDDSIVIVDRAQNFESADGVHRMDAMLRESSRLILIAWDSEPLPNDGSPSADASASRLASVSEQARLEYVGPLAANDSLRVFETLSRLKESGRPAVVHLRVHSGSEPKAAPPRPVERESVARDAEWIARSFRQVASLELARRAADDERIVAATASMDESLMQPWREMPHRLLHAESAIPFALRWCAALASEGGRPFVFLSLDELYDRFGQIRREICLKDAPVTFLVEPSPAVGEGEVASAAALAGVRQLPNVSLLAPKDTAELRQVIAWCAAQDHPAVVWLPNADEPTTNWGEGPAIETGRAEPLSSGSHVAIVAWGPMVAAADMAAHTLRQYGIEAAVINARFAQPLDVDTIARASRASLCTVLVDDAETPGGFSSWVIDRLSRIGIAQPMAIVSPSSRSLRQLPYQTHQQCALRIVDHCRWLVDPVNPVSDAGIGPIATARTGDISSTRMWLHAPSVQARDQHDEHRQVLAQQFSPFIEEWVRRYSNVGTRDIYLWRWCLHGLELTTLSCVPETVRMDLCDTKLLAVMYGVMLDDIADQGGEEEYLHELEKIISGAGPRDFSRFSSRRQSYAQFTVDLWETFESRLKRSPFYGEYEELLAYDHQQILNTMSYSCLVNRRPELLNVQEHDAYLPHNMQMMSFATMDLMNSPGFDRRELGKLREVIWHAQNMGRIGNLVSTWQREIADRDFTSGVFARALREGDLTLDDLRSACPDAIDRAVRAGGHEQYFLEKWESHRGCIHTMARTIRSVDIEALLVALERLIHMELSSRGFK